MNSSPEQDGDSAVQPPPAGSSVPKADTKKPSYWPLRIWPLVVLLLGMWALRIIPALFEEMSMPLMMARFMGPPLVAVLIVIWWLSFSRARIGEKALGFFGLLAVIIVTMLVADKSVRGFGTILYAMPWGISAFSLGLVVLAQSRPRHRTGLALLAALVAFGFWDLVRIDEIWGDFYTARSWRWLPTAEDRFLETLADRETATTPAAESLEAAAWPAFRGPLRDSVLSGVVLAEDWTANPPTERWRIQVGPGWSSFSVAGSRLFTQEQRGEQEVVVCYDAKTGEQIWVHSDESRFWETVGGAGPRGTPTLSDGMLFSLGANGLLNRLDPLTGDPVWQQDINKDAGRKPHQWGYAASPLVVNGLVIVYAGGPEDKGVLAYDAETGEPRWSAPSGDDSYSSPHLSTICGQTCVLMLTNEGLAAIDPADGRVMGTHAWKFEGYRVVQPLVVDDSSVLLGTAMGTGTQRVRFRPEGDQLIAEELWMSRGISPYYNDYVAHKGHIYGFDNNIFACVDLETGERKWKGGRYGNGQVLLLPDADQLLVISEDGELVLLRATPDEHVELGRHRVLDGRTWNHPVLVGNQLFVRNAEEAACFQLAVRQQTPPEKNVTPDDDPPPGDPTAEPSPPDENSAKKDS